MTMNRGPASTSHPSVVKQQYDTHNVWGFENRWRATLFECKPCSKFCFSCFCGVCMGCQVAKRMGESSAIGCCPGAPMYLRTKLRTARRIEGSCCGDYWATACCGPCVYTQMYNELQAQGLWDAPYSRKTVPRTHNGQYGDHY